jgi:hypothetical protein
MRFNSAAVAALAAALMLSTVVEGQTIILNETWSDGERSTQNLPNSAAWYSSLSTSTLTATTGSMTQSLSSSAMNIAYLTNTPDSVFTLAVGDTLELAYSISFAGRVPGAQGYFRAGLYNTVATPRITADEGGALNDAYVGATGYMLNTNGLESEKTIDLRRRTSGNDRNLMTSTNPYSTLPGSSTFQATVDNDLIYNGILRITATDLTSNTIEAILTGPDNATVFSFTSTDTSSVYRSFNTVGFASASSNGTSFTLTSVDVILVPEPSAAALIVVGGLGVVFCRKRTSRKASARGTVPKAQQAFLCAS